MNIDTIKKALTTGLLAAYGGKSQFSPVKRASFDLMSGHFEDGDLVYHDEWVDGGGQEIVQIGNELFTRVYAGISDSKKLAELGLKETAVVENLITRIKELGDQTRLFSDCRPENIGNWGYEYKILDHDESTLITTGKETIKYQNQVVFIHVFVLSPVKK